MSSIKSEPEKFRILVATDIHLGVHERHHHRGEDSFRTFEEVLSLAGQEDVDFILLGGDLFHYNKPSTKALTKCVELLRKYCFGSRPIEYQIVSDQRDNFSNNRHFNFANYLDDNMNISMPIFTIHGNHDDPVGSNPTSCLETLSAAGLINYFGKYTNVDEISMSPVLLQKGDTKIALYGLGSVNEERLYRIVLNGNLNYNEPESGGEEWFKIVVVHQNRVRHPNTKYLPEKFLSDLPDLVIWGHEHEAKTELDYREEENFFIYQPGSTVATSLCEAEARPKHCGLLEVFFDKITQKPKFKITHKKLASVRPMVWESIELQDLIRRNQLENNDEAIERFCREKVNTMILQAQAEHTGHCLQPKLPLIRLRLEYTDEEQKFHAAKFGINFRNKVANENEIISFAKRRLVHNDNDTAMDLTEIRTLLDQEVIGEKANIDDIIKEYFSKADAKSQLGLLSENAITIAVKDLVDKDSVDAIGDVYQAQKQKMTEYLLSLENINEDDLREEIKNHRIELMKSEDSDIMRILQGSRNKKKAAFKNTRVDDDDDDEDIPEQAIQLESDSHSDEEMPASGRGSSRGRGLRGRARGSRGGRGRASKLSQSSSKNQTLESFLGASTSKQRSSPRSATKRKRDVIFSDSDSE